MKIELVPNWRHMWKSFVVWFAATGLLLPEILQLIADESGKLAWLDEGWKSFIRVACLIGVILARPVRQASVNPEPKDAP